MALQILSLCVGVPRIIGAVHGEPVLSAIGKDIVQRDSVFVGITNIEGDGQADLSVHGGVDKAVYAYLADHWPWWEKEHGLACGPATFGENLTLAGCDESMVAIGDRFAWGDAILEISQPRAPCYKLGLHTRRPDVPGLMTLSAYCGWYFRVVAEGMAPTGGAVLARVAQSGGPSVRDAFLALFGRTADAHMRGRVRDTPALAQSWRRAVTEKIAAASA